MGTRPSYTAIAHQGTPPPLGPVQVIPERRTREVCIRAEGQAADLALRTLVEVVQAANTVLGTSEVVATCRLPSRDTILIFRDNILAEVLQKKE